MSSTGQATGAGKARKRLSAAARRAQIEEVAAGVFAERGYSGTSIDEIVGRSGVSPPVFYDHFESKRELYRTLLERHFAELRQVWGEHFPGSGPLGNRIGVAVDAWFAYVEAHPFAARVLFRHPEGDPEIAALHERVAADSRARVMGLFAAEPGSAGLLADEGTAGSEMIWVVLRGVLQGLAMWWADHRDVPREAVVSMAVNSLWLGFERVLGGEWYTLPDQLDQPG